MTTKKGRIVRFYDLVAKICFEAESKNMSKKKKKS